MANYRCPHAFEALYSDCLLDFAVLCCCPCQMTWTRTRYRDCLEVQLHSKCMCFCLSNLHQRNTLVSSFGVHASVRKACRVRLQGRCCR
eukprot:3644031-Amphidinium_carterae.1